MVSAHWAALDDAVAARAGQFGTQNQIDAPERALSYQLARLGVLKLDTPALVSVDTSSRCLAKKVQLVVHLTGAASSRMTGTVTSPYGTKEYGIQPDASKVRTFPTGAASMPAGEVTVTATARIDGTPVSATVTVPYDARVCQ